MKYFSLFIIAFSSLLLCGGEKKVVSLSPAVTQILLNIGAYKNICGISSACKLHENLPVAGDLGMPFAEKVLSLHPDIVITDTRHPSANWEILQKCGIDVLFLKQSKLRDLPENIRTIGRRIGKDHDAEKYAADLEKNLDFLEKNPVTTPLKGIAVFGISPLITCGGDTFISDAMRLSGINNIAADKGKGFFMLNPEYLIADSPEIILVIGVPQKKAAEFFSNGIFRGIPAVRKMRIIFPDENKWSRLTPALAEECRLLRERFFNQHPLNSDAGSDPSTICPSLPQN